MEVQKAKVESLRQTGEGAEGAGSGEAFPPGWFQLSEAFKESQKGKEMVEQYRNTLKDIEQAEKASPPASSAAQGSTGAARAEKSPTSEPEFDIQDVQAGELTLELKRIFEEAAVCPRKGGPVR